MVMQRRRGRFALPTANDVRPVDPVLTNLSIGFKNDRFLWDQIAPSSEVALRAGTFFLYDRAYWMRRHEGAKRAEDGRYTRVGYGVSTDTYETIERGFEKLLDDPTEASSQTPDDLQRKDVEFLTNLIQLELEKDVAAGCFVTGVWGTSTTLSGTDQWSDYDSSDPITDANTAIRAIMRNTGTKPNMLFIGASSWDKLREHPLLLDKYKHTQVGVMTEALVAGALGIDELVVGDSVENTAGENVTYSGGDIWTDNALFAVKNAPGLSIAAGALTFIWNEAGNVPWAVQNYRSEEVRGNVTRVFTHYVPKIVSSQHGYIYLDTVA